MITSIDYNNLLINNVSSLNSLNIKDAIILISIACYKITEGTIINSFPKGLSYECEFKKKESDKIFCN